MKRSHKIKKGDLAVTAAALALAAALLLLRGDGGEVTAEVSVNGETVLSLELGSVTEKREIELDNGVVIAVEPGKIYFVSSPCAGKDCVKFGELTKAGQSAVCVPEKTVITLSGNKGAKTPDAISY